VTQIGKTSRKMTKARMTAGFSALFWPHALLVCLALVLLITPTMQAQDRCTALTCIDSCFIFLLRALHIP
jgi:hypothetical protein